MSFAFSLKELAADGLPTLDEAVKKAIELAALIPKEWTKGKTYDHEVETYHHRIEHDFWMARISKHKDVSFEVFRKYIMENHTANEVKYIPLLDSFQKFENAGPWEGEPQVESTIQIASNLEFVVHYKFPRLFTDREMAVWIATIQPNPEIKQFLVISLPSTREVSEHVTRAHYCSIEVVTETGGEIEWIVAQTVSIDSGCPVRY